MIVRRKDGWLAAKVGEELVMMSAERGHYIGLSAVGARIWELIEAPRVVDEVCAELETEFDVTPAICRAEVAAFLDVLVDHGAIAIDPAPAA
jgi:Coenzyme PQQ synthesis protein D (PqqD)